MDTFEKAPLRISSNRRYIMRGDKPFFWLGDTAWLLLQKLDMNEIYTYFRNRKEKGYNVIQIVLIHSLPKISSEEPKTNRAKDVTKPEYWIFVDQVIKMAEDMNLYLGLLPSWGSLVKEGILNKVNIEEYASFLGKRYQNFNHIIWILGGDIRGDVGKDVFVKEAQVFKFYNPERLITFHPFGRTSSSLWFHEEKWLDFNMFQSGHRRYDQESLGEWDDNSVRETFFGEDNWKYVERDQRYLEPKPTLDGEPSYEGIPQGLHNPRNPYWEEWDVRRYAYWSVFAGAAGHTYGNNAIMQFYTPNDGKGSYGVRENWMDALHHAGAGQLKYLKELVESVDFINGSVCDSILLFGQKERYHRIAVFAGKDYILCYDYMGDEFLLNLSNYMDQPMDAYWMNPEDGTYSYISTIQGQNKWLASPIARKGKANDWVFVLTKAR